jgi:hypothetical protein
MESLRQNQLISLFDSAICSPKNRSGLLPEVLAVSKRTKVQRSEEARSKRRVVKKSVKKQRGVGQVEWDTFQVSNGQLVSCPSNEFKNHRMHFYNPDLPKKTLRMPRLSLRPPRLNGSNPRSIPRNQPSALPSSIKLPNFHFPSKNNTFHHRNRSI